MYPPNFVFDARMKLENDMDHIVEEYKMNKAHINPESLKNIAIQSFNLAISAIMSDCHYTLNSFSTNVDLLETIVRNGKQEI